MRRGRPATTSPWWAPACVAALALLVGVCGCGPGEGSSGKPRVVATTTQIGDLVRQIAGERVELKVIMGPGVDPHTYKPSPSDMGAMKRAQLVLYSGLHLEGKMVQTLEAALSDKAVAVTSRMAEAELIRAQGKAHDPHVWFDVGLWKTAAQVVADELIRIDPQGRAVYERNRDALLTQMDELDAYAREQFATIPEARRAMVTSHDAFAYLGRRYGLEVRGIQGISTESEAGIQDIRNAVDLIVERHLPAIFVETSVPTQTIDRVKADCRARGVEVRGGRGSGIEIYSDAMGVPGEHPGYAVETYIGMMRYNVDTIVSALTSGEPRP
jgi:manganese/zinc/iron transport system substrate-binding protein